MDIEKIKNYNHKLLASIGSILALIAFFGLISVLYFFVEEYILRNRNNYQQQGVIANNEATTGENQKLKQLISYEFPRLIDTVNLVYIIPVGQKTNEIQEVSDDGIAGLMSSESSSKFGKRYSKQFYGSFNNLLIYNYKTSEIETLFSERISFEQIDAEYFDDDILIVFKAAEKDNDKNGIINSSDLKSLYTYSFSERKLRKIGIENSDIYNYTFVEKNKDMIIQFGMDNDKNGNFDNYTEPTKVVSYNYENDQYKDIIDTKKDKELQMILEGKITKK